MEDMIRIYNNKQYAELEGITDEGVRDAIKHNRLTQVCFTWEKDGRMFKGKFVLPKNLVITNREELLKLAK